MVDTASVQARSRRAFVHVCFAGGSGISRWTDAVVLIDTIDTLAMDARIRFAFVDICRAVDSRVSR
jgi:hypothetical protein